MSFVVVIIVIIIITLEVGPCKFVTVIPRMPGGKSGLGNPISFNHLIASSTLH